RQALDSYYDINPEQRNFDNTVQASASAPAAPNQTTPATAPTVTVSTGVPAVDRALNDAWGRVSGFVNDLFGSMSNSNRNDQYTSLPSSGGGDGYTSHVPTLKE